MKLLLRVEKSKEKTKFIERQQKICFHFAVKEHRSHFPIKEH